MTVGGRDRDLPDVLPGHDRDDPGAPVVRSPGARADALLRGVALATIYRRLRLPASLPYLFTALKIAATASIVGAIIGEGPGGIADGLGRVIITYNQYYITGPEKLWAAIVVSGMLGIVFYLVIVAIEWVVLRGRRPWDV